jgi:L-aspartate oxidase
VALAYHAGARLADLEFVQFHPTALLLEGAPRFLISEALRGEGARLVNAHGDPFMDRYHPDAELAPRDVVARAIVRESDATGGPVALTLAHLDPARVRSRFPGIAAMCAGLGLDLATDRIPVGPAAHYLMGGIETDVWGRTSVRGLFAAGEVACTGVHGANRLASNSLLEGLVFGARAAEAMMQTGGSTPSLRDGWRLAAPLASTAGYNGGDTSIGRARDVMWRSVGLFRSASGLTEAARYFDRAYLNARALMNDPAARGDADAWRALNLLTVSRLIAHAARRREESRGGHFREDFPRRDDLHWKVHLVDVKSE